MKPNQLTPKCQIKEHFYIRFFLVGLLKVVRAPLPPPPLHHGYRHVEEEDGRGQGGQDDRKVAPATFATALFLAVAAPAVKLTKTIGTRPDFK